MPCLRDALYGTVNDGYEFLSEKYLNKIQNDISKNADLPKEKLSEMVGLIFELLNGNMDKGGRYLYKCMINLFFNINC